jgi:TonB-linked SusC/RagA family outer membrane protein
MSWQHWSRIVVTSVAVYGAVSVQAQQRVAAGDIRISPEVQDSQKQLVEFHPRTNQKRTISFSVKDIPLGAVLDTIAKQGGVKLFFTQRVVPVNQKISVTLSGVSVEEALQRVLRGTGVVAHSTPDGAITLVRPDSSATRKSTDSRTGILVGRVLDSVNGRGVVGASISIASQKYSTVTSENGIFTLRDVPLGEQRVHIRMLGYQSVTRTVVIAENQETRVQVTLVPSATMLSDVVTTATGLQRRLEIPTDVTRLNVDSLMTVAPIRSVTDLLATRVPGLQVLKTSGSPGDPSRLRLRGASSINASNAPIVIVDGIRVFMPDTNESMMFRSTIDRAGSRNYAAPSPLDQIDPNNIETIEVFKGPSASALYGSDAANGVIVITTKRGRPGKTRLSSSLNVGTAYLPKKFPENLYTFGRLFNGFSQICNFNDPCEIDSVVTFQAMNDPMLRPIGRAGSYGASATVDGGNSTIRYSFTATGSQQDGIARLPGVLSTMYRTDVGSSPPAWMRKPERYTSISGSNNLQIDITKDLQVMIAHSLTSSDQNKTSLSSTAGQVLLNSYVDKEAIYNRNGREYYGDFYERVRTNILRSQHTVSLQWQARPRIPVRINAGFNPTTESGNTYLPAGLPRSITGDDSLAGTYSIGQRTSRMLSLSGNGTIPVPLTHGMVLPLALGADWRQQRVGTSSVWTTGIPVGVTEPTSFLPGTTRGQRSTSAVATYGWFAEPRLNIGSRVFVQTGTRLDGGSASGSRAGLTAYPKMGISWIVFDPGDGELTDSRLASWQSALRISQLRIRGAFGKAGIEPGPTQHLRLWARNEIALDGGARVVPSYQMRFIGNSHLRPERATEVEGGVDLGLFDQRVTLTATAYRKVQREAIMEILLAESVSGYSQSVNVGDILNRGYELTANADVLDTRPVRWNVGVSVSHRSNRLTRVGEHALLGLGTGVQDRLQVGYPIFSYWAKPIVGFADQNGDGILQLNEISLADSVQYIGSPDPKYNAVFNTSLGLFQGYLQVNATFDYQHRQGQYNPMSYQALISRASRPDATLLDQAVALASGGVAPMTHYYLIQQATTWRLQSMSFSTVLPPQWARSMRMSSVSVALQGSNLWLKTDYRGFDPNVNSFASGNRSADYGRLPAPREWSLRVNLTR